MVQQNLDAVDRVLRFGLAVWWLGPWAPSYWSWLNMVMFAVGWIALAESFLGYCWLHKWLGVQRKK